MAIIRKSSVYVRHVGARSLRNVRSNFYMLAVFLWCMIILGRALSGVGYDAERTGIASSNPSMLRALRLRSQEGIEMGWERLGKPGLGIWQDVFRREEGIWRDMVRREEALKNNWMVMAVHALKNRADEIKRTQEEEHLDVAQVEEHLTQEDDDLLAPPHTYHEVVMTTGLE